MNIKSHHICIKCKGTYPELNYGICFLCEVEK
jgi:hypothetical protein